MSVLSFLLHIYDWILVNRSVGCIRLFIRGPSVRLHHTILHCVCRCILLLISMSAPSPTSPMSFNSNSNRGIDLQDSVSSDNPTTQPPVTPMLDGSRPHHTRLNPNIPATPMPSHSEWEAIVVITSAQLSQNLVLNFEQVHLQGSFQ